MNARSCFALVLSSFLVLGVGQAFAETTITVENVHLCCNQCVTGVAKALKTVDGVTGQCNQKAKTVKITAKDDAAAQKAVDALIDAGFYGKVDNAKVTVKKIDAPKGKVAKLELTGVHNCCGQCTAAIKKTVKGVAGVKSTDITNKATTFTVEGDFEPAAVIQAMLDAGFTVKVKK